MDELDDLGDVMGEDYDHGYDDGKGDPNVKPKRAAGPKEDESGRSASTLSVVFSEQQQFLTKLEVQGMPLSVGTRQACAGGQDPFSLFKVDAKIGGVVQVVDGDQAQSASSAKFTGLQPGMPYVFRVVCHNPAGRVAGKNSVPILTVPAPPPAPTFLHAKASSIFIRFPEQNKGGNQVVNRLTIGVAKAGPADPFAAANKPGAMSDSSPNCGTLKQARIQKLAPGQIYVFRLSITNAAGTAIGAVSNPMLTVPGPPSRLREDPKERKSSSVKLKFAKHGQHLSHLTLQYAILSGGKATFDVLMKKSGKQVPIQHPQTSTEFVVKDLQPNSKYVFRLASKNKSGIAIGTVLGPITTVEYAPDMNDKSGWMTEMPKMDGKKTLSKRLSAKKGAQGKKYWYVIDGRLLSWFEDIKGEESGFLHLSKLKRITYVPDGDGQARQFSLLLKTGQKITLECSSSDPNVSTHDYTMGWMSAIQKALAGMQQTMEQFKAAEAGTKKEGRRASIQAAGEDELEDDEEPEDDFNLEEEGFTEGAEDTFGMGDGDDFDDGFGGFDEEEGAEGGGDDWGGGFEAAEDGDVEGEEAFGDDFGDDDFGGGDDDFGGFE